LGRIANKLLVIDNYDSFTYNLVQMFMQYNLSIHVFRSDQITLKEVEEISPDYALISPGPGTPKNTGISMPLIKAFYKKLPVLGVCLGMQCINEVFGGKTVRSALPLHGKTSHIRHDGTYLFQDMPMPFSAARYHSLVIEPAEKSDLEITAMSDDNVIMGVSHPSFPLHGVQFHPESFMTEQGCILVENFLKTGPYYNG
jgi:para-aminobenzoate synthetase component II